MLRKIIVRGVILLLLLLPVTLVNGQGVGVGTLVNYYQVVDAGDFMVMDVYFNIVNASNQVIPDARVSNVRIELDNGEAYDVPPVQPDAPIYIGLVLDASGSMRPANPAMREAAAAAVGNAPDNAQFSLVTFNETVEVIQDFTPDADRTVNNINSVAARQNSGTCLYDGMYRAIELMANQPPGRRALVVFTDGVDERADGSICSTRTLAQVLELATRPEYRTPIYTIGLRGGNSQMNAAELSDIAARTGGITATGEEEELSNTFGIIMEALNNQWFARVQIYPRAGEQNATVSPQLEDGTFATPASISFNSPKSYFLPFVVTPSAVRYNPDTDIISIDITATGVERVSTLRVSVLNEETGVTEKDLEPISTASGFPAVIDIPGEGLLPGATYLALINAQDAAGVTILEQPYGVEFVYNPPPGEAVTPFQVQIMSLQVDPANQQVVLDLNILGGEQAGSLRFSFIDMETGADAPNSAFTLSENITTGQRNIPIPSLAPGREYTLTILAFAPDGTPLMTQNVERTFRNGEAPPVPSLVIEGIDHSPNTEDASLVLSGTNTEAIQVLRVSLVRTEGGQRIGTFDVVGVPERISLTDKDFTLSADTAYTVQIIPLDLNDRPIFDEPFIAEFTYDPPNPGLIDRLGDFASNPIVLGILVALVIFVAAFFLNRQRKQRQVAANAASYTARREKTSVMNVGDFDRGLGGSFGGSVGGGYGTDRKTQIVTQPLTMPREKTEVVRLDPDAETMPERPPTAMLRVESAKTRFTDFTRELDFYQGYVLGRAGNGHMNFDQDVNISRRHLEIYFKTSANQYMAKNLSSHAGQTVINGVSCVPEEEVPLDYDRDIEIKLGATVVLIFRCDSKPRRR